MSELAANSAMIDYFVRGGVWMWALLACSVIALTVIIFKLKIGRASCRERV